MNTITNQTAAISPTPKRVILASAYRHQRHSIGRQKQALKTLRKMGRSDGDEMHDQRSMRRISLADENLND